MMTPDDLRTLRCAQRLTQTEAAAAVHVCLRTWQRWEHGDRAVSQAAAHLACLLWGAEYPYRVDV